MASFLATLRSFAEYRASIQSKGLLMYYDLSKKEKKIARQCIDKGLNTAYTNALNEVGLIISDWHAENFNTRDAYMKLFKIIKRHDDAIARRYNRSGGSRYLVTVAQLFFEKIITEDDIQEFSDETKAIIRALVQ